MGVEVATLPHAISSGDFKRVIDALNTNSIPWRILAEPSVTHFFVPRERFDAAHDVLKREQDSGFTIITLK